MKHTDAIVRLFNRMRLCLDFSVQQFIVCLSVRLSVCMSVCFRRYCIIQINMYEQSVNPAARVGHYTRTVSTSAQNTSIWSLTAAAPSDSVIRALCTNSLTYLLTYLYVYMNSQNVYLCVRQCEV